MKNTVQDPPYIGLLPVSGSERIQALDVIRGFALLGIFLMNIEFFNRPLVDLEQGLPTTLTGIDWLAGWLIYNIVQGKFWTMFSLLFGMGFAVMLARAERAGRAFLPAYLRRIAALAVFGAAHYIFIWGGDILFSYAVGAVALLVLLYGQTRYLVMATLIVAISAITFGLNFLFAITGSLAVVGLAALFLRCEKYITVGRLDFPVLGLLFFTISAPMVLIALGFWLIPALPNEPRLPFTLITAFMLLFGVLATKFHQPRDLRMPRLGIGLYALPFLMMTAFGAMQYFQSQPDERDVPEMQAVASANKNSLGDKTSVERSRKLAERIEREKEHEVKVLEETRVLTQGSYTQAVKWRANRFAEQAVFDAGFAIVVVGMFLLGVWLVRSGVMEDSAAHLPLFRKLALYGIPIGFGLGLIGSSLATSHLPGQPPGLYQFALGLTMLGNLPACLGYVGLLVLMLHSRSGFAKISVLAPAGRMALTNYLVQSIIGTVFFYGYGLGHWGMGRAWQVVFVVVVFTLQVIFSHAWLSKFHYGPMEWLWRAITYLQFPMMRRRTTLTYANASTHYNERHE